MMIKAPVIGQITSGLLALTTVLVGLGTVPSASNAGLIFRFPPNPGPPGQRVPGGSRPSNRCMEPELTLVAIMPNTNYGLAASAQPSWYFYLPNLQADQLQFQLSSRLGTDLLTGDKRLKASPGKRFHDCRSNWLKPLPNKYLRDPSPFKRPVPSDPD